MHIPTWLGPNPREWKYGDGHQRDQLGLCGTRRSEIDNTLQPYISKRIAHSCATRVGNCKGFSLTHYLVALFAMHLGQRSIPLCIQHYIQLASLSFQVSRPSHFWDATVSIFCLKNQRSISSVRSKFKATTWVQHLIDSKPNFPCQSELLFLNTDLFRNFTLKTHGQGHSSRSHNRYNILSTRIPFVPCRSLLPFLWYSYFKVWPWKSKLQVILQCHIVCIASYRLTSLSFHANRSSHSWVSEWLSLTAFLEQQTARSM